MACNENHSALSHIMANLPNDQGGGIGRHKCAACAYKKGFEAGYNLIENLDINNILSKLKESQTGAQKHKSPLAAFAIGYYDGVCAKTKIRNNE